MKTKSQKRQLFEAFFRGICFINEQIMACPLSTFSQHLLIEPIKKIKTSIIHHLEGGMFDAWADLKLRLKFLPKHRKRFWKNFAFRHKIIPIIRQTYCVFIFEKDFLHIKGGSPSGIRPHADPKGPPLYYFEKYPFLADWTLKFF